MNHPFLLCAIALLCAPLPLSAGGDPLPQGRYTMRCEDGRISVSSNEASVEQLLTEFSQKSGVTFNKFVGKTGAATLDLKDAPFEEFLGRVLGSYVTKSKKVDGTVTLDSVTIMDEGPAGPPVPRPAGQEGVQPAGPGRFDHPERPGGMSREERRRRRRKLRTARRNAGQENAEAPPPAPPSVENPPPEYPPPEIPPPDDPPPEILPPGGPPPENPHPQEQPVREPEPSGDATPVGGTPLPPADEVSPE